MLVTHLAIEEDERGGWMVYGLTSDGMPVPPIMRPKSLKEAKRLARRIQREMKRPRNG